MTAEETRFLDFAACKAVAVPVVENSVHHLVEYEGEWVDLLEQVQ